MTTPSISKSSDPALVPVFALGDRGFLAVTFRDVWVHREAVRGEPVEALAVAGERQSLGDAERVRPHRERALGGLLWVELTNRSRRGVAGVHESRQALLSTTLVDRLEVRQRQVNLAAHFDERRHRFAVEGFDRERDRVDCQQVVSYILSDLTVAARSTALEFPVAVEQ